MPRGKKGTSKIKDTTVEYYTHKGDKRKNNPPVGLVSTATDKLNGRTQYQHDPHIDPYLSWAGKAEGTSFEVQNVSLHIHERIDPARIIKSFLKKKEEKEDYQPSLFEEPQNEPPLSKAIDFYRHDQDWTNRLIAGDSLLVMNSLLTKEGMAGKVQMVYIDPPYGIKFRSNFQPFVNNKNVSDNDDDFDIPLEPEMVTAFRDTWELGIHSYLNYFKNRILLTHDLLHKSGSIFIQISDANIHYVKNILDEIFKPENFISLITFRKTNRALGSKLIGGVADYIIWYAKDKPSIKYRPIFLKKDIDGASKTSFEWIEDQDGTRRRANEDDYSKYRNGELTGQFFTPVPLASSGYTETCIYDFEYEGKIYKTNTGKSWVTTREGMQKIISQNRLFIMGNTPFFIQYLKELSIIPLDNVWTDTRGELKKIYVVQTTEKVIERCMLMTTDTGDLVLDPTCGSGTTSKVAEEWGRRWITCDTSRVAITLAKQRLLRNHYKYYELAHSEIGIKAGLKYHIVPHITISAIKNDSDFKEEVLFDDPYEVSNKIRVTGPFTVEAVPSLRVKPFDGKQPILELSGSELARSGETGRQTEWRDELKASGIRATGGKVIQFSRVEPMTATRFLHARAEVLEKDGTNKIAYISFGPDYGPLEQRQAEAAIDEARKLKEKPDFVIFAAFHFDPEAAKDIDQMEWKSVTILKAQMSVDLLTADLRKKRSSNQSYWLIGQPDVDVRKQKSGKFTVKLNGFDYYDPTSGEIISKGTKNIAMWFLDTDYDERSIMPDQVFFPEGDAKRDWSRLAKALKSEINEEALEKFSGVESLPFSAGENKKIAVKIIDNRGIESFVIKELV